MIQKVTLVVLPLFVLLLSVPFQVLAVQADTSKQIIDKQVTTVQGKNGPEKHEIILSATQDQAVSTKRYAAADFAAELGATQNPPVLLKSFGLLVDEALENEDAESLAALSLSLAAFESAYGKQAISLTSKGLLEIAGEIAKVAQDKNGLLVVAKAYTDPVFGLADAKKADQFTQLAGKTRGVKEFLEDILDKGGVIWKKYSTAALKVKNTTGRTLDVYINGDFRGTVKKHDYEVFEIKNCNEEVTLSAKAFLKKIGPKHVKISCGESLTWTLY